MPRFELNPALEVPDDLRARVTVTLWEGLRDGADLSGYFTEDYQLDGAPLQVALLPEGQVGNERALEHLEEHYPEAVVRLQEVMVATNGRVMSVVAVIPGPDLHGLVVYIVSDMEGERFTRTQAFAELVEARAVSGEPNSRDPAFGP